MQCNATVYGVGGVSPGCPACKPPRFRFAPAVDDITSPAIRHTAFPLCSKSAENAPGCSRSRSCSPETIERGKNVFTASLHCVIIYLTFNLCSWSKNVRQKSCLESNKISQERKKPTNPSCRCFSFFVLWLIYQTNGAKKNIICSFCSFFLIFVKFVTY